MKKDMQLRKIDESNKLGLLIPYTQEQDIAFFNIRFGIRDAKRGIPKELPRFMKTNQGALFTFNSRELGEATGDSYSLSKIIKYLEQNTKDADYRDECLHDIEIADKFYTWAYVVNLQSGMGRWNYWTLYIPGMSTEEIDELIPKSIVSSSKHNYKNPPPGYSKLLRLGEKVNFLHNFQAMIDKGLTQEEYFLTKVTMSDLMINAESYHEFIHKETPVDNKDKQYFRFIRRWKSPIVLIDNNKDVAFGASLDLAGLKESYAHNQYQVFWPEYQIPDVHISGGEQLKRLAFKEITNKLSFRGMESQDQNALYDLFSSITNMYNNHLREEMGFIPGKGLQEIMEK